MRGPLRSLGPLLGLLLWAPPAVACELPVDPGTLQGPLSAEVRAQVQQALQAQGAAACGGLVAQIPNLRAPTQEAVAAGIASWPDRPVEPLLFGFGAAMLRPDHADEDAARAYAQALAGVAPEALQAGLDAAAPAWVELARDRLLQNWGASDPGCAGCSPPVLPLDAVAAQARACADAGEAPPDPFDPLGAERGLRAELAAATRCSTAAVLDAWEARGSEPWRSRVQDRLIAYSQNANAFGALVQELEAGWGQGTTPAPDGWPPPSVTPATTPWGLLAAGVVALLLLGLAWGPTRPVAQRLLALVLGLAAIPALDAGLQLAGVEPGDERRVRHEFPLPLVDGGGQREVVDERGAVHRIPTPDGEVRLAVVGASSVAGPGLGYSESLPLQIQAALADRAPCVRAVNLGHHGFAAPRFRELGLDAVDLLDADLVVVYGGHNEVASMRENRRFAAHEGWLPTLRWTLRRTALYGLLNGGPGERLSPHVEIVADATVTTPPPADAFATVLARRVRGELTDLARGLRRRDVPLLLAAPSFNRHGLRVAWAPEAETEALIRAAEQALRAGAPDAVAVARRATEQAPDVVAGWFLLALAHEQAGDLAAAEQTYWAVARRNLGGSAVTPEVRAALAAVAARQRVPFVDTNDALLADAGGRLPGFDLYRDYVHFNPRGAELVGQAIADGLWADARTRAVLERCAP